MRKIEIDKILVGNQRLSQWFLETFQSTIKKRIVRRRDNVVGWDNVRSFVLENLEKILIGLPEELLELNKVYKKKRNDLDLNVQQKIDDKVRESFNYKEFRKIELVEFAKKINVICCPYCNQSFTICIDKSGKAGSAERALLQFDHFFCREKYPLLSMSMFNLIPVCPICNHEKGSQDIQDKKYSKTYLKYHPYESSICDIFDFRISSPISLFIGSKDIGDCSIKTITKDPSFGEYDNIFHITERYKYYKDVAEEVFARAYLDEYYTIPQNFKTSIPQSLTERLKYGFYPEKEDINRRPLTKFCQDMWRQAKQNR